ncbi:MAG TPA: DUF3592 domain-containing protein [Candidatus Acidoferrales bacterium]|nr:DUF3592 domain-containing protein [Candidatus Acidoferrales bacterium]
MPAPGCPKCGAKTIFAGYDPWCPACGWNREEAGRRLRRATRKVPFGYLFFVVTFGLFFRVWHDPRPATLLFVFVFPLVPVLALYASLLWSRSRYEAAVRESAAGVYAGRHPAESQKTPPQDYRALLEMPRPRPVRISRRGRTNLLIAMLGVSAFDLIFAILVWQRYRAAGSLAALPLGDWLWFGLTVAIATFPYLTWRTMQRQKALLADGEVTLARVVQHTQGGSTFTIQYEFQDSHGQTLSGLATDSSRSIYEGMTVPVFFDPQNPSLRVLSCESLCEVVLPGQP